MTKGALIRKSLLVVQFTLVSSVCCSAECFKPGKLCFNRDTGYNKEQLLIATAFPKQRIRQALQNGDHPEWLINLPGVTDASTLMKRRTGTKHYRHDTGWLRQISLISLP